MPTLEFKGKYHIYAHHFTVPYRPLTPDPAKSLGALPDEDNLIIHGDNLHALKALLPQYAGRIKCIYIDPPYNTGNEGWVYNDNVNSLMHQEWLRQNSCVDGEDLERHDKWLNMMWPRLHLLKDLLSDDGAIFVSIDDNEVHHLRMMMDEIFGEENFISQMTVKSNPGGRDYGGVAQTHDYIVVYGASNESTLNPIEKGKSLPLADEHGYFETRELRNRNTKFNSDNRPNLYYPFYVDPEEPDAHGLHKVSLERRPGWVEVYPLESRGIKTVWRWQKETVLQQININVMGKIKRDGNFQIVEKYRKSTRRERSILEEKDFRNEYGTLTLKTLFSERDKFEYPKSHILLKRIIELGADSNSLILDSFAGSGTTAHAVLALNKENGGNRRFILVECEDYADNVTAERVRRVIQGVPNAKDSQLKEGLGGSFAYCELGKAIEIDSLLSGENLPPFSDLAAYLQPQGPDGHFYTSDNRDYYLIYEPDAEFLSSESHLNEERAHRIQQRNRAENRSALFFAAETYISQRELTRKGITFCKLPYEILQRD